jgi:dephospho-CoA kinase
MKKIGLTGGIASGKSTVSAMLKELGVTVIDADKVYAGLSEKGNRVWQAVRSEFGEQYFLPDGQMDRKAMAALVFSDERARRKLNQLTHPIVKDEIESMLDQIEKNQCPDLVAVDVPLLFESGWDKWMDEVWLVYIPQRLQIERLMRRNDLTREEALLRIQSQMDIETKRELAHRVIDNSRSRNHTFAQVQSILKEVRQRRK